MSPKVKNKSFPPVKVTEEFLELTKKLAEQADEYLSDYIRRAVEQRNQKHNGCSACGCKDGNHAQECTVYYNAGYGKRLDSTHNTVSKPGKMVQSFAKGGK